MNRRDRGCERFDDSFEVFLDGELDADATSALETHVAGCEACASELALARRVRAGLRSLPRLEAPAPAVHAVLARVRDQGDRPIWRQWLALPRPAAVAAVAALVLLVVLAFGWIRPRQPESRLALEDPAVVRATLETKLALAHFASASRRVGTGLGRDLLRERALLPLARSVGDSLDGGTVNDDQRAVSAAPERG